MLEHQYNSQPVSCSTSWTINDLKEKERLRVVRKFINSAIYVEKEVTEMPPQRKTSPLSETDECNMKRNFSELYLTKGETRHNTRHSNNYSSYALQSQSKSSLSNEILKSTPQKTPESGYKTMEQSSNSSNEQSENSFPSDCTVKAAQIGPSELRLSLSCLNTNRTCTLDPKERQEIVQNWLNKKNLEQKRKECEKAKIARQKEEERQQLISNERRNFTKWLAEKKKEEERKKAQRELEAQEERLREAEREKKKVENDISFNLWLRNKRKSDLEKQITEKLALLHVYEEKQQRMEENEKAYQGWLENSKNRQKPVPMNRGLQSLCSSASVTYINPIPWTPNINPNLKPSSQ